MFVIGTLDVGGAERHLSYVLPELKRKGVHPALFVMNGDGPLRATFEKGGVPIIFGRQPIAWIERTIAWIIAHFPPKTKTPTVFVLRLIQFAWDIRRLPALLLQNRSAVLHCFLPGAVIFGGTIAAMTFHPRKVFSRRSMNFYQSSRRFWGWLDRKITGTGRYILGNSRAVVQNLIDEGQPKQRVRLIYNGIPEMLPEERVRRRWQKAADAPLRMSIVANLIPYKGHVDLLDALRLVKDQLPSGWSITFAGTGGPAGYRQKLEGLVQEYGLAKHVLMPGSCADVASLYEQTDIALLVSHEEGFSNSILEAMACGVPMIVTDVGGNAEAVAHGRTGLVVPTRDPQALAKAILELASAPASSRAEMGRASYERFKAEFSLDRCVQDYADLYRGMVTG